jgi:hypothetical protein
VYRDLKVRQYKKYQREALTPHQVKERVQKFKAPQTRLTEERLNAFSFWMKKFSLSKRNTALKTKDCMPHIFRITQKAQELYGLAREGKM